MPHALVPWLTLGSALIVLVALLYEIVRPTEDARVRPMTLGVATLGLGAIIGSLPKLFEIDNVAIDVMVSILQLGCTVYAVRQMMRVHAERRDRQELP